MKPLPIYSLLADGTDPAVAAQYEQLAASAATATFGMEDEVCILDLETTGLAPHSGGIIEIAIQRKRGPEVVAEYSTLVTPDMALPKLITEITGITPEMLESAPRFDAIADEVRAFLGESDIVAHNAQFDRSFLTHVMPQLANRWVDSVYLARVAMPRFKSFRLIKLAEVFAPAEAEGAHRALADVRALAIVWRAALCALDNLDPAVLATVATLADRRNPHEARWIRQVLGTRGEGVGPLDLRAVRKRAVLDDIAEPLKDGWQIPLNFSRSEDIDGELGADGLAGRMHPLFEERPEQREMAREVYAAFENAENLVIEAGTGVGKSLAYLIPAASFALENGIGIGIATRTNALTNQLMTEELPRLSKALGDRLRYSAVKGYSNYLCMRKVAAALRDSGGEGRGGSARNLESVLAWVSQSPSGDIDSVSRFVLGAEGGASLRATQVECTKRRCPYYPNLCYIHGARRRAMSSNIVVTNHALLFADAMADGQILPPIRHWIIDEAHAAEASAREQLAVRFATHTLATILTRQLSGRLGVVGRLRAVASGKGEATVEQLERLERRVDTAIVLAESFTSMLADLRSIAPDARTLWIGGPARETAEWGRVETAGSKLYTVLLEVTAAGNALLDQVGEPEGRDGDTVLELKGALYQVGEAAYALGRAVGEPEPNSVYSADLSGADRLRRDTDSNSGAWRAVNLSLSVAELEVGPTLAEQLYARTSSVVFTSATLAAGDEFNHFMQSVGLDLGEKPTRRTKRLPSSYDLPNQMAIYVVSDMPEPRSSGYLPNLADALERIHRATDGGVLTLFTNESDMRRMYEQLKPPLGEAGIDLLMQRTGSSTIALRESFSESHQSSLFALKKFWEGFDVRGDTLRCVVIPKMPFTAPDDPLSQARKSREGWASWKRYDLPEATIELRQAVGRLIRSATDTGVVVLTDSRLATKPYGKSVLRALPVEPRVMVLADVVREIGERFGATSSELDGPATPQG